MLTGLTESLENATHIRVLEVSSIQLPQLLPSYDPLFLSDPILRKPLLRPPVPEDIHQPPEHNRDELEPEADGTPLRAGDVSGGISRLEDLGPTHVPDTVPDEGEGRGERPLGPAGRVGWDQGPGEEQRDDEGRGHEVAAPLGPLVLGVAGEERHEEEADEGRDGREHHEVHPEVLPPARDEADHHKVQHGEGALRDVQEDNLEVREAEAGGDDGAEGREAAVGDRTQEGVDAGEPELIIDQHWLVDSWDLTLLLRRFRTSVSFFGGGGWAELIQHTHGSTRHSLACSQFHFLTPVRSWPVLLARIRTVAIFFSLGDSHRTSDGVPRRRRQAHPTRIVSDPRKYDMYRLNEDCKSVLPGVTITYIYI